VINLTPGGREHLSNLKGKDNISSFSLVNFLSKEDFTVGVFSGIKRRKEDGVEALSAYRDRYEVGRKCTLPLLGPVFMTTVNHELRACEKENVVKTYHVWLLWNSP